MRLVSLRRIERRGQCTSALRPGPNLRCRLVLAVEQEDFASNEPANRRGKLCMRGEVAVRFQTRFLHGARPKRRFSALLLVSRDRLSDSAGGLESFPGFLPIQAAAAGGNARGAGSARRGLAHYVCAWTCHCPAAMARHTEPEALEERSDGVQADHGNEGSQFRSKPWR